MSEEPRFVTVQDVVNWGVDASLTHIENDYILRTARAIFQKEGRGPARDFIKKQCRNFGRGGPDIPSLDGTPTGIKLEYAGEVYTTTWNEMLSRALDPSYRPSYKHVGKVPPLMMVPEREEFKPPLKALMVGRVLDGYVEAARVKPLTEFALSPLEKRRKELLKQAAELKKRLRSG